MLRTSSADGTQRIRTLKLGTPAEETKLFNETSAERFDSGRRITGGTSHPPGLAASPERARFTVATSAPRVSRNLL
jgi:hypothetical protein